MRSSRRPQAQQICSGQQNSVQELLLSSVPVNRISFLNSGPAEAVPKLLCIQQCHLLYERAALVEETSNVIIRVVIDEELLVPQLSLVEARDDRTGVEYMRYSVLLQRLQVPGGTDRPYTSTKVLQTSTGWYL